MATGPGSIRPRRILLALLLAEFLSAVLLLTRLQPPAAPPLAADAVVAQPTATGPPTITTQLPDGRRAEFVPLGGTRSAALLSRVVAELPAAVDAVTDFWGPDWRREIVIVATGSDPQFAALAGGGADIAAATTADRIVFAPGAATMTDESLRTVLRHEMFHHAVREQTAADAPRWLTEGVADYLARPRDAAAAPDPRAALPTDSELDTPGPTRSLAYDRAWRFAAYVADRYGPERLRGLYVRACGPGHHDLATSVRDTLGSDLDEVLVGWRQWRQG
ncbi:peptidase [Mycolicibacterium doricum]|uniref:Peptidase n=1 Tax=Mycolicibacterium doricum TaxID=126673 RepID=A0A1X1T6T4_9MYCO|nr:peptidase [Mycolicibacterium doricum]MCV7267241.1 peptidase [Mycolicibacterium doricum]ORV40250.1 peptidase [Mycolicibacterium doricum]BBZ08230.1 peptidase [Mycolicibacterium doricum]